MRREGFCEITNHRSGRPNRRLRRAGRYSTKRPCESRSPAPTKPTLEYKRGATLSVAEKYEAARESYDAKTVRLAAITDEKATKIAETAFPVPGVTFSSDGVLVNGLPFDQASSAEQLQIAVGMGLSANPELKVVLIRDGSLLDERSLAAVAEMADKYDAQIWLERVGEGKEVSVVIADGRVLEDRTQAQAVDEVAA